MDPNQVFLCYYLLMLYLNTGMANLAGNIMNGVTLRLAVYQSPPFDVMTILPNGSIHMRGSHIQVYGWLADRFNFTLSFVPVIDQELINRIGVFEAAIVKLSNKEVDGLLASQIVTPSRKANADFTCFMVWSEPYTFVTPKPELESRLFAFIKPFQPLVWLFLGLSSVVIIGMMTWFSKIYNHRLFRESMKNIDDQESKKEKTYENQLAGNMIGSIGYYTIYAANILTNHGMYTPFAIHSFRILAGCWLLATSVLVYGYSSTVVAALTVPKMKPAVNTFEDLVESQDVSLLIRGDLVVGQQIMGATSGVLKILGDQLRANRDTQICLDFPSLYKRLSSGRYAFPFITTFTRDFVVRDFIREKKCRFQISPPIQSFSMGYYNIFVQKGSNYKETLNIGLQYLWETGLPRYWMENLTPNQADQCFAKNKDPNSSVATNKIKLQDLISAFLILGIGVGISILCFLVELIFWRIKKHRANRVKKTIN